MSQESQPSSSISARLIGRNGAVPKRWAQYLRYEKSGLKSGSDVSIGRDLYGRRAINSMPNSRICAGATGPVTRRYGACAGFEPAWPVSSGVSFHACASLSCYFGASQHAARGMVHLLVPNCDAGRRQAARGKNGRRRRVAMSETVTPFHRNGVTGG